MTTREEALRLIRERMDKERKGGSSRDPFEWRPPKVNAGEEKSFQFYVLPAVQGGETIQGGPASKGMDGLFYTTVGTHWINGRPQECPRIHDKEKCPLCDLGFDLLREETDQDARREIAKKYMPTVKFAINAYFPDTDANPEDLRDVVRWIALPKTILDIMEETINRDGPGRDKYDPQPYGLFFSTGVEEWCDAEYPGGFLFKMVVKSTGGFNDYKSSKFIYQSLGPIAAKEDGSADVEKIQAILEERHDIFSKYSDRDLKALQEIVNDLVRNAGGSVNESSSGFDRDETVTSTSAPAPAPAPKTSETSEETESSSSDGGVEIEDDELQALMDKIQSGS